MTEPRPLLAFAPATSGPIPTGRPFFIPPPRRPTAERQGRRLTPQFSALRDALNASRARTAGVTTEPDPELVVVFDLAGSVDRFMRAIAGIDGLEFLAEVAEDAIDPDEDFYFETKSGEATDAMVPETLYMVMSNAQAVSELIRLFELWKANPNVKFERGLAPLKQAFAMLRAVRRWGAADRVRETGLLQAWEEDVKVGGGQGVARVEIELWFREDAARRTAVQAEVERVIAAARGEVICSAVVSSIDYHAVLADLPFDQVEAVVTRGPEAIELLTTESIMFVAPARPMTIPALELASELYDAGSLESPSGAPPRVALLDGLPLANHTALAGRLVLDDPDERSTQYSSGQQYHGTAMASLICHGDLSAPGPELSTQLYVRPIMEPHPFFDSEVIARDELLVDLLHRALHRMFEGDGDQPPAASSVRIVNLSIGDPARVFDRRVSPLAKLLDWLAHRYNVLVLVSAGNHAFQPAISAGALDDLDALRREVLAATYAQARQRRLLSPAEAVNVVTVGALHADFSAAMIPDTVLDAVEPGMPASYGAVGFGHRRSVKPEILLSGGRQLFQRPPPGVTGAVTLTEARHSAAGPGLLTAAPDPSGGADAMTYSCGTSNAAALATRTANQIFDVLTDLTASVGEFPFPDAQYHPVLAKTLLVHAASWGELPDKLRDALDLTPRTARRDITQLLGYGPVDPTRVARAARTRVVLLGAGSITNMQRQRISLPLPPVLAATTQWRRLTITLGWLSPINPRSQIHRMARLWFHPPEDQLGVGRTEADQNAARKGTVQHEVLEGTDAVAFAAGDVLTIDVDCRVDAGKLETPIRYGIAVSVEMATTVQADIHAQIRQGLQVQVRQQQQVTPR
jgi:Subtilase family